MVFREASRYPNQKIRIPIRTTNGAERIVCRVYHPSKPNTVYFQAEPIINGEDSFIIKIPKSPRQIVIEIYNEKHGNINFDPSFQIGAFSYSKIDPIVRIGDLVGDPVVQSFVKFSDHFAENAGILSADLPGYIAPQSSIYKSPDGKFQIDYVDVIRDDASGKELRTPARVNSRTGVIQISKKYYIGYTVPGRKAINLHEFCHINVNINKADELEADRNAIMIYLGMGNPTVEAYNVFLKVFKNTPSGLNKKRYDEINKLIRTFAERVNSKQLQAA